MDGDGGVEEGDLAAGGFGFGEGVAGVGLLVDEQPEPVGKCELVVDPGRVELVREAGGHGAQPEGFELGDGLVRQHHASPVSS